MTDEDPERSNREPSHASTGEEWLDTVRAMVQLFEHSDAQEVRVGTGALRLRLRRGNEGHLRHIVSEPIELGGAPPNPPGPIVHRAVHVEAGAFHDIRAPLTGIWYDAPSPGVSPYVQVGSHVEVGTVIGLIETMKIFNEISADAAGRVAQIHVRGADLVQVNSALLTIDTADTASLWPNRG